MKPNHAHVKVILNMIVLVAVLTQHSTSAN